MRKAGLTMPLLIDAPDCGTSLDAFLTVGQQLITADPSHNFLLSAHAYWAAYDGLSYIKVHHCQTPHRLRRSSQQTGRRHQQQHRLLLLRSRRHPHRPRQNQRLHLPVAPHPTAKRQSRLVGLVLGTRQLRRPPAKHQQHLRLPNPIRQRHHAKPNLRPQSNIPPLQTPLRRPK
jgi:hypothetical protein